MNKAVKPAVTQLEVQNLLEACGLPYEDITASKLSRFLTLHDDRFLTAVVGLELYDNVGLLRSLAVHRRYRGQGLGSEMVGKAEEYARVNGLEALYLLTTTAGEFFEQRGYEIMKRDSAPIAIQNTSQFTSLCPDSAVCMIKWL